MNRFFISPEEFSKDTVHITGDDFKHLSKVLRLKPGDQVMLCNGAGEEALSEITSVNASEALLEVKERTESPGENKNFQVSLFQGIPKQGKLELIVQKGTELGVKDFFPFYADRSVPKPGKSDNKKVNRLNRVAYEASKQTGRGIIPEVNSFVRSKDLLNKLKNYDLILVPYENERDISLKKSLQTVEKTFTTPLKIALIIGPEGGFSQEEINSLKEAGASIVSLGPRILRTETAGLAALAQINYALEEL